MRHDLMHNKICAVESVGILPYHRNRTRNNHPLVALA